jgi:hypothetical protein
MELATAVYLVFCSAADVNREHCLFLTQNQDVIATQLSVNWSPQDCGTVLAESVFLGEQGRFIVKCKP